MNILGTLETGEKERETEPSLVVFYSSQKADTSQYNKEKKKKSCDSLHGATSKQTDNHTEKHTHTH